MKHSPTVTLIVSNTMPVEQGVVQVLRAYRNFDLRNETVAEMADITLSIVDMTGAVKTNKESFLAIERSSCEIVANIIDRSHMTENLTFAESKTELLRMNLRNIRDLVRKHVQRRGLTKKILWCWYSDIKTIRECRGCLQECYNILELQYTGETWDHVNVLTRQVQELLEHQRQSSLEELSTASDFSTHESRSSEGVVPTTEERGVAPSEQVDNPTDRQAVNVVDAGPSRLAEGETSLTRDNRADTRSNIIHAHIGGNAVSTTMGTVINVRGSRNRLRITLRA